MLFDKLYVLAKGGICIYSGPPQQISTHLKGCDINLTQIQVPIEVLLKHACSGSDDQNVINLAKNTSKEKQSIIYRSEGETILFPDGVEFRIKNFLLIDLWFLFLRTITYTYRYFWKLLLLMLFSYLCCGFFLTLFFRDDIGKVSGCISFEEDFNSTCNKTKDKIKEESLLTQNINYNIFVIMLTIFLQIIATTMTFTTEVKIFFNEHRNGRSILFS
jgi:hypothetical protein